MAGASPCTVGRAEVSKIVGPHAITARPRTVGIDHPPSECCWMALYAQCLLHNIQALWCMMSGVSANAAVVCVRNEQHLTGSRCCCHVALCKQSSPELAPLFQEQFFDRFNQAHEYTQEMPAAVTATLDGATHHEIRCRYFFNMAHKTGCHPEDVFWRNVTIFPLAMNHLRMSHKVIGGSKASNSLAKSPITSLAIFTRSGAYLALDD